MAVDEVVVVRLLIAASSARFWMSMLMRMVIVGMMSYVLDVEMERDGTMLPQPVMLVWPT